MSITFNVCAKDFDDINNDQLDKKPEWEIFSEKLKTGLGPSSKTGLESSSSPDKQTIPCNGMVGLVGLAFDTHCPLILDPDTVWVTIISGLATHINLNSEKLRDKFVDFKGKKHIEIVDNSLIKGCRNNNWQRLFPEFSDKIFEYIGDKRDLIVSDFSTTTPLSKAISEIVLMDAMKSYFDYGVRTSCGIQRVTLEGTVEDWKDIRNRVDSFDDLELGWWMDCLKPVLDEFVTAAEGNIDIEFWKSFYNKGGGSGGPFVSGHINKFYPYLIGDKKNELTKTFGGTNSGDFPTSFKSVPFEWLYYNEVFEMEFIGGIIGADQEEDGSVRSSFSWAVRDVTKTVNLISIRDFPTKNLKVDLDIYDKIGNHGLLKDADFMNFDDQDYVRLDSIKILMDGETEIIETSRFFDYFVKGEV